MVPRESGLGSAFVARVDASLCVSCGLCVGSCDRLSIGPLDRSGPKQMSQVGALGHLGGKDKVVLLYCSTSQLGASLASELSALGSPCVPFGVECMGSVHPFAVHALLNHFAGVFLLGCPPAMCQTRDGYRLLDERVFHDREPGPKVNLERERLRLYSATLPEQADAKAEYLAFVAKLGLGAPAPARSLRLGRMAFGAVFTMLGLIGLALASGASVGQPDVRSVLRLSWRLPGQESKDYRTLSEAELMRRPAHMRQKQECKTTYLSYQLRLRVDGAVVLEQRVVPGGAHGDAPLNMAADLELSQGPHRAQVSFEPINDVQGKALRLNWQGNFEARSGRVVLLTLDSSEKSLEILTEPR